MADIHSQKIWLYAECQDLHRGGAIENEPCLAGATLGYWDLIMRTHRPGRFQLKREFLLANRLTMHIDAYESPAQVLGACKANCLTVFLPLNVIPDSTCFGKALDQESILASFDSSVDANFGAGQRALVLLIEEDLLSECMPPEEVHALRKVTSNRELRVGRSALRATVADLLHILTLTQSQTIRKMTDQAASQLEFDIVERVVSLLWTADSANGGELAPHSIRRDGFERALQILDVRAELGAVNIRSLSSAAGVSQRTLEYAFKDYLGCSPKSFIKYRQLYKLRQRLLTGDHCPSVQQVAFEQGIYELGRMAGEYRKLFDELPSATLARRNTTLSQGMACPARFGSV